MAVTAQFDHEAAEVRSLGADTVVQLYSGVGKQLADAAVEIEAPR